MSGGANSNAVVGFRTRVSVRTVLMHREKFLVMATCDLAMSFEDALSKWEQYKTTVDRDQLGPPQSPLRLHIPMPAVEDSTFTETEAEHAQLNAQGPPGAPGGPPGSPHIPVEDSTDSTDSTSTETEAEHAKLNLPDKAVGPPVTIATMNLKVFITVDGDADTKVKLSVSNLEKMEDDFQTWSKKTRNFMQESINDVDETLSQTPPKKQMKCNVDCGTWTTSLVYQCRE
jgi:hypothetical protein